MCIQQMTETVDCRAGSEVTNRVAWRLCMCMYIRIYVCNATGMQLLQIFPVGVALFSCLCSRAKERACTTMESAAERWR